MPNRLQKFKRGLKLIESIREYSPLATERDRFHLFVTLSLQENAVTTRQALGILLQELADCESFVPEKLEPWGMLAALGEFEPFPMGEMLEALADFEVQTAEAATSSSRFEVPESVPLSLQP